ncbi:MAG: nitrilase-related carbon-nitrogen hydrolase [Bacteroidaceae bacterium]
MKISLLQRDIQWADPEANKKAVGPALLACTGSDLCVLPEMWPTGFLTEPSQEVCGCQRESLDWLQSIADKMNFAIVGSMATMTAEGEWRNRLHFIRPGREPLFYDKRHLFTYGGEHTRYSQGDSRLIVEWRGTRFMPLVCYDLRFPMWSRNKSAASALFHTRIVQETEVQPPPEDPLAEYDVLLYVASWPASRIQAWKSLLVARAIENQCYVCGVNRVGHDSVCEYSGGTLCVDPYGNVLGQAHDYRQETLPIEIDMERLRCFRMKFPVLADAD